MPAGTDTLRAGPYSLLAGVLCRSLKRPPLFYHTACTLMHNKQALCQEHYPTRGQPAAQSASPALWADRKTRAKKNGVFLPVEMSAPRTVNRLPAGPSAGGPAA